MVGAAFGIGLDVVANRAVPARPLGLVWEPTAAGAGGSGLVLWRARPTGTGNGRRFGQGLRLAVNGVWWQCVERIAVAGFLGCTGLYFMSAGVVIACELSRPKLSDVSYYDGRFLTPDVSLESSRESYGSRWVGLRLLS